MEKSFCQPQSVALTKTQWAKRHKLQQYIVVYCNSHSFRNIAQESWNSLQLDPKVIKKQQLCCIFQYWWKYQHDK